MKQAVFIIIFSVFCFSAFQSKAQGFASEIKKQESQIKSAYKRNRITEKEYYKLLDEQASIKNALRKYNADGHLSRDERNKLRAKMQKAESRLHKYQRNREVY